MKLEIKQVVKIVPLAKRPNISRLSNYRLKSDSILLNDEEAALIKKEKKELEEENKKLVEQKSCFYFSHKVLFDDSDDNWAVPLQDGIFTIPKIGQYVIVFSEDNISLYVPSPLFENNSSEDNAINIKKQYDTYKDILYKQNKIKNTIWPREGSTQLKNENGKAYLQLDNDDFMLATGYSPIEYELDKKNNAKYQEGIRVNPSAKNLSFIFGSNFENMNPKEEFDNINKIHNANDLISEDSQAINDSISETLSEMVSFKTKINNLFNIGFISPTNPIDSSASEEIADNKKHGLLIASNDIYLTDPNIEEQEIFKAAKGESVM
jgi:hypothetical protein